MVGDEKIAGVAITSYETPEIGTELGRLHLHWVISKSIRVLGILAALSVALSITRHETRMILENGLVIHIWEWNEKAKELGLDKHPNAGLISQDVEHMFPEAVIKDENGYLMVDLPVLMDTDDLISKLLLEGGVARLVQHGNSGS